MHYSLEIVLPPTDDIEGAIAQIMEPFDEQGKDEEGDDNRHGFYDYYVIGGRYSGKKLNYMITDEQKEKFDSELKDLNLTVSSISMGKQELQPSSQKEVVDSLWRKHFPELAAKGIKKCPWFAHFDKEFSHTLKFPNVTTLGEMPVGLSAARVIIAAQHWNKPDTMEAKRMVEDSFWNGVTWVDAKWDGKVQSVIDEHKEYYKNATPESLAQNVPQDDWLVVTVDYHN